MEYLFIINYDKIVIQRARIKWATIVLVLLIVRSIKHQEFILHVFSGDPCFRKIKYVTNKKLIVTSPMNMFVFVTIII